MKTLLQRLIKFVAYLAAGVVILLAVAVGLFRLFLPRLPEYQDEIKAWASEAIGMQVDFSGMDARWGLSGPQLEFYDTVLVQNGTKQRLIAAEQVSVGVALTRLLLDRTFVVDRVVVRDTRIELRQLPNGRWWIQGMPADELVKPFVSGQGTAGEIEVVAERIELLLIRAGDERPTFFNIQRVLVQSDEQRISIDAFVGLPESLGQRLQVGATKLFTESTRAGAWDITLDASGLVLPGLARLDAAGRWPVTSGTGGLDASFSWADDRIKSATAELALDDIAIASRGEFSLVGRVEYRSDVNGWLAAADDLRISTATGTWPETSLHLETSTDRDGNVLMLDVRADYLDLGDIGLIAPLLADEHRRLVEDHAPDGIIRDLVATLSETDTETPRYAVSADLQDAGIAAVDGRPGLRGFSGLLRADRSGGRLEINSEDMVLDLTPALAEPVAIDQANGTVIWRRSGERVTVLSDNIAIRSPFLESQSNVQLTLNEGEAPVVDLESNWSISDIGSAKRFIPRGVMHPKLYQWFQNALVSGRIPRGTTRLYGSLAEFPFDSGEGRFRLEAKVVDSTFRFLPDWPAAEIIDVDVVMDNARLYSVKNRSINRGREVVDAKVAIDDLRKPVLSIDSHSTGTLESIHSYAMNSPISRLFGGHLDRVRVSGDAAFELDLVVPITDPRSFTVAARVVTNEATLSVDGMDPPVTGLTGALTINRDSVSSEALGGQFLGQPVSIDIMNAPEDMPGFQVLARARGSATSDGLIDELGLPVNDLISGRTDYEVDLLFPRRGEEQPVPFTMRVSSDLVGLAVDLPEPFLKPADEAARISGNVEFMPGGRRIKSHGSAAGGVGWRVAFAHERDGWDLERGTLALGGMEVGMAETRGLHIRGRIDSIRVDDWLRLSRGDEKRSGTADRIRSIDVDVGDLRVLGQHLQNHRVQVDRSARDWLVQMQGDSVSGSIFVPYDFGGDRALVLDMERLILPGDEGGSTNVGTQVDPRSLPPISLKTGEFALGDRHFGAVETEFARTPEGLVADSFTASDNSFEIVGNARWIADPADPIGHRSTLVATLTSTDVTKTMQRLDYQPGIVSDDMSMLFDVSWSGGPRAEIFDSLNGEVQVRFGAGQLDEIEPGAGRLFGLMSIVELPRRLSLDFTDVFDKGFGFDTIEGSFRIVDGEAYTCNLSLEGPAADIAIIGRASLTHREYDQAAVVSANFGNTLPVVGAVVAGPQAAAALLIFSQIFKKPLREMSQVYYGINGPWDDPLIESTDAAGFASSVELAGCIRDSG